MSLVHGQEITAQEVEQLIGSQAFNCTRFASLCNAIVWSAAGSERSFSLSLTERVLVRDNGIDAELCLDVGDNGTGSAPLSAGWNVFQYKQRTVLGSDRTKIFAEIKKKEKRALRDLYAKTNRRPDEYVVFTNVDLTHGQKEGLKKAIIEGYDEPDRVRIEVVGAAELAAALNNLPHLRSAFFSTAKFQTREEAWKSHIRQKAISTFNLIGRDGELSSIKALIDSPETRAIIISGPWGIGKSRLALEATMGRSLETVFSVDPQSLTVSDLLALRSPGKEVVAVIEDPDLGDVERYVEQALACGNLKVLVTSPVTPSLRSDKRVAVIELPPLEQAPAEALFKAAWGGSDFGLESWVLSQAGGNPAVILHAAAVGAQLRKTAGTLIEEIAGFFEDKVRRELGPAPTESLRVLSVLTHVGIAEPHLSELKAITQVFGTSSNSVLNELGALVRAGIVRLKGPFAEVTPAFLANRLALSGFRGNSDKLYELLVLLVEPARFRLMRRLSGMGGEEVSHFWDGLFGPEGLFNSFTSALANIHLLRLIAATVPNRVAHLIEDGLAALSLGERQAITGDSRRDLRWVLEELLFRKQTSITAVRCLMLLAEAETESWSNNATGVLCESFLALHPQIPLSPQEKLKLVREMVAPERSSGLQLIGIKAIQSGLARMRSVTLRQSSGPLPLDSRPVRTYGELYAYIESLTNLLIDLALSGNRPVADAAADAIPDALFECFVQAHPEVALQGFRTVIEAFATHEISVSVGRLTDRLRLASKQIADWRERSKADPELAGKHDQWEEELRLLIGLLDTGEFATRLKRWAGAWTNDHGVKIAGDQEELFVWQQELQKLAKETIDTPGLLTGDLLSWLCSREAQHAGSFFYLLGELDTSRQWIPKIEELGKREDGALAFANYLGAVARMSPEFVVDRLDELEQTNEVAARTIVLATWFIPADGGAVQRIARLLSEGRVDPSHVEQTSHPSWFRTLSPGQFQIFLEAIARPELQHAMLAVRLLDMWLFLQKPIEGDLADFAWKCLESAGELTVNDAFHCDHLAAELAKINPEKGFGFLERILQIPRDRKNWRPTDRYDTRHAFWEILSQHDHRRGLRVVLDAAFRVEGNRYSLTQDLRELASLERDADILIEFASMSEQHAEVIAAGMTSVQHGFWPLAFRLIENYPNSPSLLQTLSFGAEQMGEVHTGPGSSHVATCLAEVEAILGNPSTLAAARPWLEDLRRGLVTRAQEMLRFEITAEVNDWRRRTTDGSVTPERLWAIQRLIRDGRLNVLAELIRRDEMLSLLPRLSLSEAEIRTARNKIRKWKR